MANLKSAVIGKELSDFGQHLRAIRLGKGMTQDQLSASAEISKPYLSNIETGRIVGPPSDEKLHRLEVALNLRPGELQARADWLRVPLPMRQLVKLVPTVRRTADGAVDLDATLADISGNHASGDPDELADFLDDAPPAVVPLHRVPLINRVAAGAPMEATDLDYPPNIADRDALVPGELVDGCFALRIDGDSMWPMYQPGDIVIFAGNQSPQSGDDCLVRLGAQENFSTTFKRIHFVDAQGVKQADGQYFFLEPLNSQHVPRIIPRDEITGIYPAIWRVSAVVRAGAPHARHVAI